MDAYRRPELLCNTAQSGGYPLFSLFGSAEKLVTARSAGDISWPDPGPRVAVASATHCLHLVFLPAFWRDLRLRQVLGPEGVGRVRVAPRWLS